MKIHLVAAVLICALLSFSCADVAETDQILTQLVEVPQNVDHPVPMVAETIPVGSPEIEKVLTQISELIPAAAGDEINVNKVDSTDAIASPHNEATVNNRESKQFISFIPSYVLRQAIRMAQEEQNNNMRSFRNYVQDDDSSDEVEEERSVRRRKRFRKRTSNDHLKKTRRHKNTNRHRMNRRKNVHGNRRTQNRRGNTQNVTQQTRTKRPLRRNKNKRKKAYKYNN